MQEVLLTIYNKSISDNNKTKTKYIVKMSVIGRSKKTQYKGYLVSDSEENNIKSIVLSALTILKKPVQLTFSVSNKALYEKKIFSDYEVCKELNKHYSHCFNSSYIGPNPSEIGFLNDFNNLCINNIVENDDIIEIIEVGEAA